MSKLHEHTALIKRFVTGEIPAPLFEMQYISMMKNEITMFLGDVFFVLNELFIAVDAYCSNPALRQESDLNDEELLEKARQALDKLS